MDRSQLGETAGAAGDVAAIAPIDITVAPMV